MVCTYICMYLFKFQYILLGHSHKLHKQVQIYKGTPNYIYKCDSMNTHKISNFLVRLIIYTHTLDVKIFFTFTHWHHTIISTRDHVTRYKMQFLNSNCVANAFTSNEASKKLGWQLHEIGSCMYLFESSKPTNKVVLHEGSYTSICSNGKKTLGHTTQHSNSQLDIPNFYLAN